MRDELRMKNHSIVLLVVLFVLFLLCGCRSVKYVPVETVVTDTTYINKVHRDSIYQRDSIYVHDRGDTVTIYRDRYLFVDKAVHDTLYINRTDSIRVPYPVEKELTRWERFRLDVGGYAIFTVIVVVLIVVGCLIYKLKKGGGIMK